MMLVVCYFADSIQKINTSSSPHPMAESITIRGHFLSGRKKFNNTTVDWQHTSVVFVCQNILSNDAKQNVYKNDSGPAAATCRLGSWRPTGEVPLHLGRAMMMMHTSWFGIGYLLDAGAYFSLSNLPALNTWSQKGFWTILHLPTTGFSFGF